MARLTLGDQVSIVSTGEKGTIVGESNGLYDVRIGGAGTMETRRGVRRRDLERFVPEFSSPFRRHGVVDARPKRRRLQQRQRRPCYMTARPPDANKRALTPPSPIGRSTDDATTLATVRAHNGARITRRPPLFRRPTFLRECVTYPDGNN